MNDPDDNEIQSAYQIIVASSAENLKKDLGDVWNSNKVTSRSQNYVYFNGNKLSSATRYYWKVRTWDKDGNVSPYSEAASFETGLLTNNDWSGAQWIKRNTSEDDDFTYYRKKFALTGKKITSATVYVTACHSYDLYVNGTFVGKGFNHHYPQYSYYHAWDITKLLSSGSENVFACLTHWYGGGQGRARGARGLILKTIIRYSDASETIIDTDNTWKQTQAEPWIPGQPQRNGEGIGRVELFDSRKVMANWNAVSFDDTAWEPATVIGAHPTDPWTGSLTPDLARVTEKEIKPASVVSLGNGKFVIDLGKIDAGSFKIPFNGGNSGDTVKMFGGYVLNSDGTVSVKMNQGTNMKFNFILNGSNALFNPYVYLGMRYLQIENSPNNLSKDNVSFVTRHYGMDTTRSEFISSVPMLNSVWNLMCHSLVVGSQEGFVDTPTREKGGFLGDGWSQSVPALSVMYDRIMSLRSLTEFLTSQDHYWPDGRLNAVYPNVDGGRDIPDYTQSFLVWAWDYYLQTGNMEFLVTNYERLRKIANYVDNYKNGTTGLIHKLAGGKGPYEFGIIDWPANMRYGYDMNTDSRTVVDAYAYADFDLMSKIAEATGNIKDKDIYRKKAVDMEKAINAKLINKNGVYIDGLRTNNTQSEHVSQHANIMPLALGIVPPDNLSKVVEEVKNRKMSVGMVCLRWLPEALGKAEQGTHLVDLYTNPEWDGWAQTISLGGTVTWESWNANETNESMSHPWGAVGLLGMQQFMLGISPLKPQHELVQIKPLDFGTKLQSAKGRYPTDKGDILLDWKKDVKNYTLNITLPDNITANVYIPSYGVKGKTVKVDGKSVNGKEEGAYIVFENIGSGKHTFVR
jgi:alpha-L-rhamnosidase